MPDDFFDAESTEARLVAEALVVDVDGFEGPLDLLLTLARTQKVDLRRISILRLAEQYLGFVEAAKRLRIELAADYLELAARLAFQLERLEAMRDAAARLMARDQLGRDVFARGETEKVAREVRVTWTASLVEVMRAYARIKTRDDFTPLHLGRGPVYTMEQALERMRGLVGTATSWVQLSAWLPDEWRREPAKRRSATAASFAAALELVKAGRLEVRQEGAFAPIFLRQRDEEEAR